MPMAESTPGARLRAGRSQRDRPAEGIAADPRAADPLASHPLRRLFDPRGVAVVGASQTPGKYGYILLKSLVEQGYQGGVYPVNPKGGELLGRRFLASLEEAEGPIDIALVVRPAAEVLPALRQVVRRRVPFAVVYAAGFAEHGDEGRRLERRMVEEARAAGTRIVGPNCMNISSLPAKLNLSAIVPFPAGGLGFLSASGNLGFALAHDAARRPRVGFSRFISAGNQADLALDDYLDYLRLDPHTRAVLIYSEGFVRGRGRAFLEQVARTAAVKPVLVLRGGRTRAGRATALSHTGALAGEAEVARQALEQAGAVLLDREDEALDIAQVFLHSPLPAGARAALVGEGGGHATLIADAAAEAGLEVRPFPEALVRRLRPHLPGFVSILRNPVEFGGHSEYDIRTYDKVLGPVLDWDGCDLAILFGGYALYDEAFADLLARRRDEGGKPILVHDLYADEDRPAFAPLRARGIPLFVSADVAARAAAALARGGAGRRRVLRAAAWRARQAAAPRRGARRTGASPQRTPVLPAPLRRALASARRRPARALLEEEASRLLEHFGFPVLPSALARSERQAIEAAGRLGYPVALKVHSASILHKSDAGGVHLDLRTDEEVRRAWQAVARLASRAEARLAPFRRGGVEAIAGARRDPEYGPILLFGAGGVLTEILRDAALRTLPCPPEEIEEMVGAIRLAPLLAGARGARAADLGAVRRALHALARLILEVPEVSDVEVNPLRCAAEGAVALDARILVSR
jgi:acetyltransferase